jgi:hypothetical protein
VPTHSPPEPEILTCYQVDGKRVFPGSYDDERHSFLYTNSWNNQKVRPNLREDNSPSGHGMRVASKIPGRWGTAKGVTIVPVHTLQDDAEDLVKGFNKIYRDLKRWKDEGQRKSVSVTLFSTGLSVQTCPLLLFLANAS